LKKVIIEIGHPAHVHQFKNMYWELVKLGWKGLFVTKDKECAIDLLKAYGLPHVVLGANRRSIIAKLSSLPFLCLRMLMIARKFGPEIFVSRVSPISGWVSFLMRKHHITFTDTENVKMLDSISEPFADVVLTSNAYLRDHGRKQIRYPGYHELAYLHTNRFAPDPGIFDKMGLEAGQPFALVRFVSWTAHHDIGHKGLSLTNKVKLVEDLAKHLRVLISSEGKLPDKLECFRIAVNPEDMHDVLAHAHLFIGESATMASECAMLGTPAIYINSNSYGCIEEQKGFGLLDVFPESEQGQLSAMSKAIEYAMSPDAKPNQLSKREKMLLQCLDVTEFMTWFVNDYPDSAKKISSKAVSWDLFR